MLFEEVDEMVILLLLWWWFLSRNAISRGFSSISLLNFPWNWFVERIECFVLLICVLCCQWLMQKLKHIVKTSLLVLGDFFFLHELVYSFQWWIYLSDYIRMMVHFESDVGCENESIHSFQWGKYICQTIRMMFHLVSDVWCSLLLHIEEGMI